MNNYIREVYFEKKANNSNETLDLFKLGEWDEIESIYLAMVRESDFHLDTYLTENIARLERHQEKMSHYGQGGLSLLLHLKEKNSSIK